MDDDGLQLFGEVGDFHISVMEKTAVHVGEGAKNFAEVWIAFGNGRVENLEKRLERVANYVGRESGEIVAETRMRSEQTRILGKETEHEANAKHA